jgi:type VI secretion system VasD/TssJ family lipoprotein
MKHEARAQVLSPLSPSMLLVFGALVMSCSSRAAPAKEAQAACALPNPLLTIIASDRLNTTEGQGHPVQVRLYQLKNDARLLSAKFDDIWQ